MAFPVKGQVFFFFVCGFGVFLFVGVKKKRQSLFDWVKNSKKGGWLPSIPNKLVIPNKIYSRIKSIQLKGAKLQLAGKN